MKIRSINPGRVTFDDKLGGWVYSYVINGFWVRWTEDLKPTAKAAKQAMRERVAQERKRHAV